MVKIQTYRIVVKHDHGKTAINVVTPHGEEQAITQVMKIEMCPREAVQTVKLISTKLIK